MASAQRRSAWIGDDLQLTGEHLLRLTEEDVAQLARELPGDFRLPDPESIDDLRSAMAGPLGRVAEGVADRIAPSGPGLAIATGNGLDVFGLSVLLGRPMGQNSENELIVSVRVLKPADVKTARGYTSNDKMLMHTDPTDVAGLLCLQQSAAGGSGAVR